MVKILGATTLPCYIQIHVISRCVIKGLLSTRTYIFAMFDVCKNDKIPFFITLHMNHVNIQPTLLHYTDFIPDSEDTSADTSREVTQANISQNNGTAEDTKSQQRPKVVSLVCRAHEGQLSAAPYSIKPTQLVSLRYHISYLSY